LFRNVPSIVDPFDSWKPLNLPPGVNVVNRMVTLDGGIVVITTNDGIWWAEYGFADVIDWHQALVHKGARTLPLHGAWQGLARTGVGQVSAGTQESSDTPLLFGELQGDDLIFSPAAVPEIGQFAFSKEDKLAAKHITIASCDATPARAYAVMFHDQATVLDGKLTRPSGRFFRLLRTDTGGRAWVVLDVDDSFMDRCIDGQEAGGFIKNLAVHPILQNRVALCGLRAIVSDEGGKPKPHFTVLGNDSPHVHHDTHTLVFAPDSLWADRVFVRLTAGYAAHWTGITLIRPCSQAITTAGCVHFNFIVRLRCGEPIQEV
jgi:hypothetical protein